MVLGRLAVLMIVGWFFSLTELGAQTKPTENPKYGGRVIYASLKDITTTNPFRNTYSIDYIVRSVVFEGLTGLDKAGNVVPGLSKSWQISKDGLNYTFSLRSGVKFHNGKGLTAEDVKWSIDYLRDPKNRAYYVDQFTEVKSVDAADPLTVVFTLTKPFSPLATVVATAKAPILPAGSQLSPSSLPPGTGPFQFAEWQTVRHLSLKGFKDYWIQGVPYLSELIFKPIPDDTARVTALKAKEVDMADDLPYLLGADQGGGRGFDLVLNEAGDRRRILLNTRIPPFNDVRVRQAVAFAIDKKELSSERTWGFAKPTNQRFPSSSRWFIDLKDREQDLQKAKSLLAEAGYRDGLKVKVAVFPGPDMDLLTVLKDQLKRAGITLDFDVMDSGAYTKVRQLKQFTLRIGGMGGRSDPDQVYYADMHSRSSNNDSGYSNPEADRMLETAREILDFKERKRLYTSVLQMIQRDVPEIYLSMGPTLIGVRPNVKGFSTAGLEERVSYMGGGLAYTWVDD